MTSARARDLFIGREREMAELTAALNGTLAGRGRMVMLVGEPGIGKTRTAEELAGVAESQGGNVLWGRCPEERGAPPYWPWVQIIRSLIAEQDASTTRDVLGSDAGVIAEVVAAISDVVPELEPPPALSDPDAARFRLYDAITSFLKRSSQVRPLLLVLDNLHWADGSSLRLLEFLAQELSDSRLLILGTYRDVDVTREHPLFNTLGELTRQRLFSRVLLRGLSPDEVGRVIESAGGAVPPSDLISTVHTQTEGNPLFVGEMARFLAQEGLLGQGGRVGADLSEIRLPEGIREVIGRRLNRLSISANEVLTTAAIIGRDFTLGQLSAVITDTPPDVLIETLEEAVGAKVVDESPIELGRFEFAHALIQQTLRDELTLTNRVRMHARIAEALEEFYGDEAEDHAAELALHFEQAQTVLGPAKTVQYSLIAGEQALAQYAFEQAAIQFERGAAAKGDGPLGGEAAHLMSGLGRARMAIFPRRHRPQAIDTLKRAVDYYAKRGDLESLRPILSTGMVPVSGGREYGGTDVAGLLEVALEPFPTDDPDRIAAMIELGQARLIERGDVEGGRRAIDEADRFARERNDARLAAAVKDGHLTINLQAATDQDRLAENSRELVELARGLGEKYLELRARFHLVLGLGVAGSVSEGTREARAYLDQARELRDMNNIEQALQLCASRHASAGEFELAWPYIEELHRRGATRWLLPEWLHATVGDFEKARRGIEEFEEQFRVTPPGPNDVYRTAAAALPQLASLMGDHELLGMARSAAQSLVEQPASAPMMQILGRAYLGWIAIVEEDAKVAAEIYPDLQAAELLGMSGLSISTSPDRLLGGLARLQGKFKEAAAHYGTACTNLKDRGYRPELAWACSDYSGMLLERDAPGDREKATELQDQAVGIARELGMVPLEKRLIDPQETAASMAAPALAYPAGLTGREVEVLLLMAKGKTIREIASELVISPRTVQRHTANLYAKINARNRAEATAFALSELAT